MKLFLLSGIIALTACTAPTTPIKVDQSPLPRPNLIIPNVDQFRAKKVDWIVITEDNAISVFEKLKKEGKVTALFAVTETGYENIAINTKESLRVILQQKSAILGYKKYYIAADKTIYEYNSSLK